MNFVQTKIFRLNLPSSEPEPPELESMCHYKTMNQADQLLSQVIEEVCKCDANETKYG